jgi:Mn-dependent DtxR family transcriptional regulator
VTETQKRTLGVIACLTLLQGRVPTLRELAEVLHCSKPAVFDRLHWLEKKGLWQRPGSITPAGLHAALGLPASAPTDAPLGR